ncbi:MAG: hypothetical protein NUV77_07890, partial [Thermoguttaceae bacterium]|nr:hypothetical protein [Thermoguttaceae bacterium]
MDNMNQQRHGESTGRLSRREVLTCGLGAAAGLLVADRFGAAAAPTAAQPAAPPPKAKAKSVIQIF